ncbi:hypothetical protein [Paenibacillus spongiae]|uniref:Helix-turn-helix domain-containing protein n=1 Tax=Paenibacillus spongiae TaxID=2909671 RepID=A0ABY5SI95_9BACL|nr:hypothetical protein [Paenibacillus spongiae]UVI32395.1 hypothetical protein L1F29_11490 [Paenibacillus spongiae]
MDKRQVIAAYRRGFITVQECAQILGLDIGQLSSLLNDPCMDADSQAKLGKQSVNG